MVSRDKSESLSVQLVQGVPISGSLCPVLLVLRQEQCQAWREDSWSTKDGS